MHCSIYGAWFIHCSIYDVNIQQVQQVYLIL